MADTFNLIGIKQFDRKKESENKVKNRMKSYQNRGKSLNQKFQNLMHPSKDSGINSFITFTGANNNKRGGQAQADLYNDDFT